MKCIHCGSENAPNAKYCFQCGKEIAPVAPFKKEALDNKSNEHCCPSCGAKNSAAANFCKDCGKELPKSDSPNSCQTDDATSSMIPQEKNDHTSESKQREPNAARNDTICPYCKESDCTPMQKSTTEVNTKTYKWGSGCCGMFLLGPFGLLCGMCGTGSKVKTDNELWWTCLKCGREHLAFADAIKKWETIVSRLPIAGISWGIEGVIAKALFKSLMIWWWGEGLITSILTFLFPIFFIVCIAKLMNEATATKEISEQFGEPIEQYLTKEQKDTELKIQLITLGITLFICYFGVPILDALLGE